MGQRRSIRGRWNFSGIGLTFLSRNVSQREAFASNGTEEHKIRKKISREIISLRLRQYYLAVHRRVMPENDGFIRRLMRKLSDEKRENHSAR